MEPHESKNALAEQKMKLATDVVIRIGLLLLMAGLCFRILAPFIEVVIWAFIIAITADSAFDKISTKLGGRRKLAATGVFLVALAALFIPAVLLTETFISGSQSFADQIRTGEFQVPHPPDKVAEWPLIGESLHPLWLQASENLAEVLQRVKPQLLVASRWLVASAGSAGIAIVQLAISFVIACFMLVSRERRQARVAQLMQRLAPGRGPHYSQLASATIKSVVQGLIGVAAAQAVLAGITFLIAGIPAAGLWALLVMISAVVQLPVLIVMLPPILIAFKTLSTGLAIGFTVWCVVISLIDNVLKPILFGRGVQVPTIVIFLGAIGGMLSMGILGLFLGAVILALGYELLTAWIAEGSDDAASASTPDPTPGEAPVSPPVSPAD